MYIELTKPNLVYVAFRHRAVIVATMLGCLLLGTLYCAMATTRYRADASLVVNFTPLPSTVPATNNPTQPAAATMTPLDHEEIINTHILELKSEELAREVIAELGVYSIYPQHHNGLTGFVIPMIASLLDREADDNSAEKALDAAASRFVKKDLVVKGEPRSNFIYISVFNPDHAMAVRITQHLIDLFLQREAKTARNPRSDFVRSQLEIYEKQAAQASDNLEHVKATTSIFSLETERKSLVDERAAIEQSLFAAHNRFVESQQRYQWLSKQLAMISPVITTAQNDKDPMELSARANLAGLQQEEMKLANTFGPDSQALADAHARVARAGDLVAQLGRTAPLTHSDPNLAYQQLQVAAAQAKADLEAARTSEDAQKAQLAQINRRFVQVAEGESAYQNAQRTYELADQNYRAYLQGVQEARVSEDLNKEKITSISIFDAAHASLRPASPKVLLTLVLAVVGGLFLGIVLAFASEIFDETINTPAQAAAVLGLPVVGSMPVI